MKLELSKILVLNLILLTIINCQIYEKPTIIKKDNPYNQPWNPRIDTINDSSANNYQRYLGRKAKSHVTAELVREFSIRSFKQWLDYLEKENLKENTMGDMIDNVSTFLGKSINLQSYINLKSGLVLKKLALLDMKLKQIEVLENSIKQIEIHPADIHSNLGSNLVWKSNLESLVDESASLHSGYNLAWNSICQVLGAKKDHILTNMISSKHIAKPAQEKIYYPEQEYFIDPQGVTRDKEKEYPVASVRDEIELAEGKKAIKASSPLKKKSHKKKKSKKINKQKKF